MLIYRYQRRLVGIVQCGVATRLSRRIRQPTGARYIRYYIFVLVLLYITYLLLHVSSYYSYYYICVLILLYMCPDATVYVSSCLMSHVLCLMPHASCLRWYTCGVNDFMSSFAGMHQEEFLARMVLTLLALLVQKYKY